MKSEYRIDVSRRNPSDRGYETDPYSAVAWHGASCIGVQYGSHAGLAFQKAWNIVQEARERESVTGDV